jgi:guanylate kinase
VRRNKGRLFVISAPSGAGKTSLCQALVLNTPGLEFSVSYTTRAPRPGEVNDRDYTFLGEEEFREMTEGGMFLEWARVHGAFYGTSRQRVAEALDAGTSIMLDIDVQGAKQLKGAFRDGVFIFILPPSRDALRERLFGRGDSTEEEILRRMKQAADEMREYLWYDYVIINNDFDTALKELEAVMHVSGLSPDTIDPSRVEEDLLEDV